jgi:hypothetical protein
MNEGRIVGELTREEASQERIMALILKGEGAGVPSPDTKQAMTAGKGA